MLILSLESLTDLGVGCEWIRKRLYDQSQGLSALRGQGGRAPGLEAPGRRFIPGRHHTQRSEPRRKLYPGKGFTLAGHYIQGKCHTREVTNLEKACTQRGAISRENTVPREEVAALVPLLPKSSMLGDS